MWYGCVSSPFRFSVYDKELTWWEQLRCRIHMLRALHHARVKVLTATLLKMNASVAFFCVRCENSPRNCAGFSLEKRAIWMCGNHSWGSFRSFRQALTHELIHALDFEQGVLDLRNPRDAACSELRAYHLSAQCSPDSLWHWNMFQLLNGTRLTGARFDKSAQAKLHPNGAPTQNTVWLIMSFKACKITIRISPFSSPQSPNSIDIGFAAK